MRELMACWPPPLFRKWVLTVAVGIGYLVVGAAVWLAIGDRVLLMLSATVFLLTLVRAVLLFRCISLQEYEVVEGVCIRITQVPLQKCRRVRLLDAGGEERTLLLNKQANIQVGNQYRFYFQHCGQPILPASPWLQSSLSTGSFLSMEDLGEFSESSAPTAEHK